MNTTSGYRKPSKAGRFFHRLIAALAKYGVSLAGTRLLYVRGRKTGAWRTLPVNVLNYAGERYVVSPRGQTQWVRNLRAAGTGKLRLGRRVENFRGVELADQDKPALLRAYLQKWSWQVGTFFDGLNAGSSDAEFRHVAGEYPVFQVQIADRG